MATKKTDKEEIPVRGILERVGCPYCGQYDVEKKKPHQPNIGHYTCRSCKRDFSRALPEVK